MDKHYCVFGTVAIQVSAQVKIDVTGCMLSSTCRWHETLPFLRQRPHTLTWWSGKGGAAMQNLRQDMLHVWYEMVTECMTSHVT